MPTTRYNPFLQSYPYAGYLSEEETEEEKNPFLNPPRPEPGPPPPDMESMKDLYAADLPDEGVDPNDPETQRYIERSKEALPSQGMYSEYASRRPDFKSEEMKPKWWELLIGGLAQLSPSEAHKRAGAMLPHKRYQEALRDWETEGKYLSPQAKAADEARKTELGAERFGIIGQAKRKQFEEGTRKAGVAEKAREAAATAKEKKEERLAKEAAGREERQIAAMERANAQFGLAQSREARAEEEQEARETKERGRHIEQSYQERKKLYEAETKGLENKVKEDIVNNPAYKGYFATDKSGKIVITKEGEKAGIRARIASEIEKRKKQKEYERPMMVEFDEE